MALILDTNALSALAEGDPALQPVPEASTALFVPVITLGEQKFGIRHSRFKAQHK